MQVIKITLEKCKEKNLFNYKLQKSNDKLEAKTFLLMDTVKVDLNVVVTFEFHLPRLDSFEKMKGAYISNFEMKLLDVPEMKI